MISIAAEKPKKTAKRGVASGKATTQLSLSELQLLTLLAEKPLLSGKQMLALSTSSGSRTNRLLARLQRCGLLVYSVGPGEANIPANRYFYLSSKGICELARQAGVTPVRYVKEHWLSASRLTMLFNSLDHTKSSHQFFIDLACRARKRQNEALEIWLDEAAASQRYLWHGEVRLLRPDGYGLYRKGGEKLAFFLEWDSGNSGIKRHRRKLRIYHEYRAASGDRAFPAILVVTVRDRVRQLNRAVAQVGHQLRDGLLPVFIATRTEIETLGAFGCRWWDVRRQQPTDLESAPGIWIKTS